jgi:hypothetical protein
MAIETTDAKGGITSNIEHYAGLITPEDMIVCSSCAPMSIVIPFMTEEAIQASPKGCIREILRQIISPFYFPNDSEFIKHFPYKSRDDYTEKVLGKLMGLDKVWFDGKAETMLKAFIKEGKEGYKLLNSYLSFLKRLLCNSKNCKLFDSEPLEGYDKIKAVLSSRCEKGHKLVDDLPENEKEHGRLLVSIKGKAEDLLEELNKIEKLEV